MTSMSKKIAIVGPAGIDAQARKELAARCSALTRSTGSHFEVRTPNGNAVMVNGDPSMPDNVRSALADMIDRAVLAAQLGAFDSFENK